MTFSRLMMHMIAVIIAIALAQALFMEFQKLQIITSARILGIDEIHEKIRVLERKNAMLESVMCHDINMRGSKIRQLSIDECKSYMSDAYEDMKLQPTPTALEKDTVRPGLGFVPTPCDPHKELCLRIRS